MMTTLRNHENGYWNVQKVTLSEFIFPVSVNHFTVAVALAALLVVYPALAHDSWIARGGLKNAAGEWCCGAGDCAVMDPKSVGYTSRGYAVSGMGTIDGSKRREFYHEFVPETEAQPSPDGAFWRCKRPDGSRRCFFAPPPNG